MPGIVSLVQLQDEVFSAVSRHSRALADIGIGPEHCKAYKGRKSNGVEGVSVLFERPGTDAYCKLVVLNDGSATYYSSDGDGTWVVGPERWMSASDLEQQSDDAFRLAFPDLTSS